MKDFKKGGGFRGGGRSSSRPSFGGRPNFGSRGGGGRGGDQRGAPQLFDVTCDDCAKQCQVPFRPSSDKPVYCRDCFSKKGDRTPSFGGQERRDFGRDNRSSGSVSRPVAPDSRIDDIKKQLEVVNTKLDQLLQSVKEKAISKAVAEAKEVKPEKKTKPITKKKSK